MLYFLPKAWDEAKQIIMRLSVFKKAFNRDIKIIRVGYFVVATILVFCAFIATFNLYQGSSEKISDFFKKRDMRVEKAVFDSPYHHKEVAQLQEQFKMIEEIKVSYLYLSKRYGAYNYSFTVFFSIFSVISGILGFLILKIGWDNVENFYLKASFLGVFFCTTLFGILPNVFGAEENINKNLMKYDYYNGLQLDIYNLVEDNEGYLRRNTRGSLDSLNRKIMDITKGIKDNQDLYFDVHIDKVPTDIQPLEGK